MEIEVRYRNNIAIIDVEGEIIGDARFALEKLIDGLAHKDEVLGIILNLEEVPMVDSVGLGIWYARWRDMFKKGFRLVFLNCSRGVRYLLVITKLDQVFEQYDDEDEALKSFKKVVADYAI